MWDLPGPGLEPVSPALAGGFLTTPPPGKSHSLEFCATEINSEEELYVLTLEVMYDIFIIVFFKKQVANYYA